jgi:integrase
MFKVAFLHGLRVSEVINLTKEDIRDGYIKVQRLKGSEKTTHLFVKSEDHEVDEAEGLQNLYSVLKPGELLFPMTRNGVYKLMQRAGKRAGIPAHKLHPHSLKHSCAMNLIDSISIHELKEYLGHKSLNSTGMYLNPDEETVSKKAAKVFAG